MRTENVQSLYLAERKGFFMNLRAVVVTGAFLATLGGVTVVNLLAPQREFSDTENRTLQTFPALSADEIFSGRFMTAFDTYASDQFVGRDAWVGLKSTAQFAALNKDNGRVYFGRDGYLFEKTEAYDSSLVQANCEAVASFIDKARALSPGLDARVMLVPTAAAILPEKLPPLAPVPTQAAVIDSMRQAVGETALVDPTGWLSRHKEQGLYYRTDHHWTTAGAYIGYLALMEGRTDGTLFGLDDFERRTVAEDFYGTIQSKCGLPWIRPDTMEIFYNPEQDGCTVTWEDGSLDGLYDPSFLQTKDKYAYFLGGNHPLTRVATGTKNGKTLLLLKDSYANAMVPFLTQHYETIVLVDLRYYRDSLLPLFEEGVDDLLILYNVSGFAAEKTVAANLPLVLPEEIKK
jgi:hypothetical protein